MNKNSTLYITSRPTNYKGRWKMAEFMFFYKSLYAMFITKSTLTSFFFTLDGIWNSQNQIALWVGNVAILLLSEFRILPENI